MLGRLRSIDGTAHQVRSSVVTLGRSVRRVERFLVVLSVVHPVPSVINATLVAALAIVAGATAATVVALAVAMLGFQFSIGALNDVVDAKADVGREPSKPIPAGLVPVPIAAIIVVVGAAVGLMISAMFGITVAILGALGYGSGVAYDVPMRRRGLGWLCFAAAFPLLLTWTWVAAAGSLPPGWPFLLPVASLAGPALHLANSLVDMDADAGADRRSLATRLGSDRARWALAILMSAILALAWATVLFAGAVSSQAVAAASIATIAVAAGVALSWQEGTVSREAGWLLQAIGLATMAVAWLASMVPL
jgi:4-hydroxybenzoate polyprenyltransferase